MKYTVSLHSAPKDPTRDHLNIYAFQFGEYPAPDDAYQLVCDSVPANSDTDDIFWFESDVVVPDKMHVRYNIRIEVDAHNSTNLQIRISPGQKIDWRWTAPIGFQGPWTTGETHAPWSDDGHEYLVYIKPTPEKANIWVYIGQRPVVPGELPTAFFPPGTPVPEMLQSKS